MSDRPVNGDAEVPEWVCKLGITDRLSGEERARATYSGSPRRCHVPAKRRARADNGSACTYPGVTQPASPPRTSAKSQDAAGTKPRLAPGTGSHVVIGTVDAINNRGCRRG
jgi:hypothetical protein